MKHCLLVLIFGVLIAFPSSTYAQNLKFDEFPGGQINVLNLPGASQIFGTCTNGINPNVQGYVAESMSWQFRCFASSNYNNIGTPSGDEFKETYSHPFWGAMY